MAHADLDRDPRARPRRRRRADRGSASRSATPSRSWRPTGSSTSSPTWAPCTRRRPRCRSTTRSRPSRSPSSPADAQPDGRRRSRTPTTSPAGRRRSTSDAPARSWSSTPTRRPEGDRFIAWDDFVAARRGVPRRARRRDRARGTPPSTPDAPATILYTSGTTGQPQGRGAHPPQRALRGGQHAGGRRPPRPRRRQVSYLPLAHIAERVLGLYGPQVVGSHMLRIGDPAELLGDARRGAPDGVLRGAAGLGEDQDRHLGQARRRPQPRQRQAGRRTRWRPGWPGSQAQEVGGTMTPEIEAAYQPGRRGDPRASSSCCSASTRSPGPGSAAAPMPLEVAKFMAGLGIKVFDVYGMTETCGAVTANGPGGFRLGTVGRATPGHGGHARRGRRGAGPRPGHHPRLPPPGGGHPRPHRRRRLGAHRRHRHPRRRRLLRDRRPQEGADHHLAPARTSRPSNIENYLKESPIVGHAMAIGDNRPYVVAILTLDGEIAPLVAQTAAASSSPTSPTCRSKPEIRAMAQDAVDKANARLSRPEQVKSWELLPRRVDRRVRGAHADAQAQAPGREQEVRRRGRPALRGAHAEE